ncbi:hypothetical protein B0H19DRAFT_594889 [Mycena capillaripes]|nr:hypothetical protein B0H19DRAFT_594889 [Mycena capillaripes]
MNSNSDDVGSYEETRACAGSVPTFSVRGAMLSKDHYVVLKGRPVRIVDLSFGHPGKGTRKMHIVAVDVFTGNKSEEIRRVDDSIDAPTVVAQAEYTLVNIDAPILNLLTDDGEAKDDVNVPTGVLGARLAADFALGKDLRVMTVTAMGEEQVRFFFFAIRGRN